MKNKKLYVFDVEGTLEAREGWQGIPLDRLRELREDGVTIYIVGAYEALAGTTTEFPNGWSRDVDPDKASSLIRLSEKHPDLIEKVYVGDKRWDKFAAEEAGWYFVAWDQFELYVQLVKEHGLPKGWDVYSQEYLAKYIFF
jgi:hypothetical protein